MNAEDAAWKLYQEAMEYAFSEPDKALSLLNQVIKKYPETSTTDSYAIDQIIMISTQNKQWDQAIHACEIAGKLKPDYRKSYKLEIEALKLEKASNLIGATEKRYQKETLSGEGYGTARDFGDKFASLGEHDRAWELYNRAVTLAIKQGKSPHSVRQSMANLLVSEGKTEQAIEIIITGIAEAKRYSKSVPKSLFTYLRKLLRQLGIKESSKIQILIDSSTSQDVPKTIRLLHSFLSEIP